MPDTTVRRPRRIVARTLGFGLSALLGAGLVTWAPDAASGWNQGAAEATLWQLLNGARTNNGLAPLQANATLVALARWRSEDMLTKDYFSHTIPSCGCLVYAFYDSNGLRYTWAGENIGWNSGLDDSYSPVRVHEAFMASAGHRANVLTPGFTHGGVGAAARDGTMFQGYVQNTRMYTELFMQAASAPAPAPAPTPAPAPAPRPPSQTAPAPTPRPTTGTTTTRTATRTVAPTPKPEPKPKPVSMDAPQRPASTVGLDGVATPVSAPERTNATAHVPIDEVAAEWPANARAADKPPVTVMTRGQMEVSAAAPASAGLVESLVGAILGFLFG